MEKKEESYTEQESFSKASRHATPRHATPTQFPSTLASYLSSLASLMRKFRIKTPSSVLFHFKNFGNGSRAEQCQRCQRKTPPAAWWLRHGVLILIRLSMRARTVSLEDSGEWMISNERRGEGRREAWSENSIHGDIGGMDSSR